MIFLETSRFIIRDNKECDLQDLFELTVNPVNMKYMKSTKIESFSEAQHNLENSIKESISSERVKYYFAIIRKEDEKYIGAIGYEVEQKGPMGTLVELGYFIKHEFWNMGIVTETAKRVIEYAFLENNVHKVFAGCLKENKGSENVMIKLGMKKEAELKKHQFHEGEWKDRLIYGLLKEDWNK
jgi:[ribosomal protein S5]-alanine N-acetyltransferase